MTATMDSFRSFCQARRDEWEQRASNLLQAMTGKPAEKFRPHHALVALYADLIATVDKHMDQYRPSEPAPARKPVRRALRPEWDAFEQSRAAVSVCNQEE